MEIYKDPSSSASRKRKAEESDEASESEQEIRPQQRRATKKAKATIGYGPGADGPYRGTAPARALAQKSTNAPLKVRDQVAKQDTKNLNRDAPRQKVFSDVSDSSSNKVLSANVVDVEEDEPAHTESTSSGRAQSGRPRTNEGSRDQSSWAVQEEGRA